jgi:hypothetical protein
LYWVEDEDGTGKLSLGQADGKTLAFRIRRATENSDKYRLELLNEDGTAGPPVGNLAVEVGNQSLRAGTWSLNDGSAGTFEVVVKKVGSASTSQNPVERSQVQIANKDVPLGAITIYRPDLFRIIAELESYYEEPVIPVIRAQEGDQVIVRNAHEYLARGDLPDKLREITIGIEANAAHGLKKIVNLTLSDDLDSKISVSSPDELWTEAVAQRLSRYMQEFTSTFTGFLRRHGLNVNLLFVIGLLIALPEFELVERSVLAGLVLILMLFIAQSHKLVPFARIYLDPDRVRKPYSKEIPSVILGVFASAMGVALTALPTISAWLTSTVEAILSSISP